MSNIQKLRLDAINILAGTQSRAATNENTVLEYAEALEQGAEFPPVVVFSDGSDSGKWLADGFHRYLAHQKASVKNIACDIRIGTLRDAKLFSNGANGTHGLPRTNADKNRAVMNMLADDEWKTWSQEQIAKACRVSTGLVSKIINKASLHGEEMRPATRTVTRNGVTYDQNTANIGKPATPAVAAPSAENTPPRISPTSTPVAAPNAATAASAPSVAGPRDDQSIPGSVEISAPYIEDGAASNDEGEDLIERIAAENQALQTKLSEANTRVAEVEALLAQNDLAAQVDHWRSNFEGISNLNQGLIIKLNKVEPDFQAQCEMLREVRAVLGVEHNWDIVPALKARRAA